MYLTKAEKEYIQQHGLRKFTEDLYKAIREYCYYDKITCFPCRKTLAKELRCSERTVDRHITLLCKIGMLKKIRRGKMVSNLYELPIKLIGETVVKAQKKSKEVNGNLQKVSSQKVEVNIKLNYIIDDYTPVVDEVNTFKEKYGSDVVDMALSRIKGKKISIIGFKTYFTKVIDTVLQYISNKLKYEVIKNNFRKIRQFTKFNKQKAHNFNNYEQRQYDFNSLEKKLLGWEDTGDTTDISSLVIGTYKQSQKLDSYFDNYPQRTYDMNSLEKKLLGWD